MNICALIHFTDEDNEDKQLSQNHTANEGGSNSAVLKVKLVSQVMPPLMHQKIQDLNGSWYTGNSRHQHGPPHFHSFLSA